MAFANGSREADDEIYKHIGVMEGNEAVGYIPSSGSGVTIGMGIDLLHQTERGLLARGIPPRIVNKLKPYLGRTANEVRRKGLSPSNLRLSAPELRQLNDPFIVTAKEIAYGYGMRMSKCGKAVLASLRHWAGRLGNTRPGKLARRTPDNRVINFVWGAISDRRATDGDLLRALESTLETYTDSHPLNRRTIQREIAYLRGPCR